MNSEETLGLLERPHLLQLRHVLGIVVVSSQGPYSEALLSWPIQPLKETH